MALVFRLIGRLPYVLPRQAQDALHEEIARRYAWQARDRRERRRPPQFCYLRLRQLERIYADRYGPTLPGNRAGRDALFVAAQHIAQADETEGVRRSSMRVGAAVVPVAGRGRMCRPGRPSHRQSRALAG
jgi:hypothetical protein